MLFRSLGIDFEYRIHTNPYSYEIEVPDGGKLIIKDDFFSRFSESTGYLDKRNIPGDVDYIKNAQTEFNGQPVLFGSTDIKISDDNIFVGADIFAATFFMLTRWEEFVIEERDLHNRFPGSSSLAFKNNFLDRPVVNEYADLLWELLLKIGYKGQRRKREFTVVPTHDIDQLLFWDTRTRKNIFRNLTGDLFKRKIPVLALQRIKSYCESFYNKKKDPNNSFDYFMNLAEKINVKAIFYFLAGGEKPFEDRKSVV